jgi:hypothetical protein
MSGAASSRSIRASPINWTKPMDELIVNVLMDQVNLGQKCDNGTFTTAAWRAVVKALNEEMRINVDITQCKSHMKHLRSQYHIVKDIKSYSGFGWNDELEMVIAEDDVWEIFVKVSFIKLYDFFYIRLEYYYKNIYFILFYFIHRQKRRQRNIDIDHFLFSKS